MTQFDRWLTTQEHTLWLQVVRWVVMAWIWAFIIMFLGYMILSFFGQIAPLPLHQPIPGNLGDTVVTTTQPGHRL